MLEFDISLLDAYSPTPSHNSLVLIESPSGTDAERLLYERVDAGGVIYVDSTLAPTAPPPRIRDAPFDVDCDGVKFYRDFDDLTTSPPSKSFLSTASTIIVDGMPWFDTTPSDMVTICRRLGEYMDDAYVLFHHSTGAGEDQIRHTLGRQADIVAEVTPTDEDSQAPYQFHIRKNRFGEAMANPIPITFNTDSLAPEEAASQDQQPRDQPMAHQSTDTGTPLVPDDDDLPEKEESSDGLDHGEKVPPDADRDIETIGLDITLGSEPGGDRDNDVTSTASDTASPQPEDSPATDPNSMVEESPGSGPTPTLPADEEPDKPSAEQQPPRIADGNARGRALLDKYGVRSKFDVEKLEWTELTGLAGDLGVAVKQGDRKNYEQVTKNAVVEILNGDTTVETPAALRAAIESPQDVMTLTEDQLETIVQTLEIDESASSSSARREAVAEALFGSEAVDDTALDQRSQSPSVTALSESLSEVAPPEGTEEHPSRGERSSDTLDEVQPSQFSEVGDGSARKNRDGGTSNTDDNNSGGAFNLIDPDDAELSLFGDDDTDS